MSSLSISTMSDTEFIRYLAHVQGTDHLPIEGAHAVAQRAIDVRLIPQPPPGATLTDVFDHARHAAAAQVDQEHTS